MTVRRAEGGAHRHQVNLNVSTSRKARPGIVSDTEARTGS